MKTKLNQKGFALVEAVLIIVVAAALIVGGTYIYHRNKRHSTPQAHAAAWTVLKVAYAGPGAPPTSQSNITAKACKTAIVSAQIGGDADVTYRVTFNLTNTNPYFRKTAYGIAPEGTGYAPKYLSNWYANAYQSFTLNLSRNKKEVVYLDVQMPTPTAGYYEYFISDPARSIDLGINPAYLANC